METSAEKTGGHRFSKSGTAQHPSSLCVRDWVGILVRTRIHVGADFWPQCQTSSLTRMRAKVDKQCPRLRQDVLRDTGRYADDGRGGSDQGRRLTRGPD